MEWFWTWSGKCFGYRKNDVLRTFDGRDVGRFKGDEVYGKNGNYLGEIRQRKFLITNKSKKGRKSSSFTPFAKNVGYVKYANYVGYVMISGYEDFPVPEEFH